MKLFLLSLLIYNKAFGFEFDWSYSTIALKGDNLVVFDYNSSPGSKSSVTTYTLKDGPLKNIIYSGTVFQLPEKDPKYTPKFLGIPFTNHLWMIGGRNFSQIDSNHITSDTWTSKLSISENKLSLDTSLIPIPNYSNFPLNSYTSTVVNYGKNSILYIIGGFVYSDNYQQTLSNSMFKFDFNTKKWENLSDSTQDILPPIAGHRTVLVDNRYLLIMGGLSSKKPILDKQFESFNDQTKPNSLEIIWQYDIYTGSFKSINTKSTLRSANSIQAGRTEFSIDAKDKKVYLFGGLYYPNESPQTEKSLGILDFNTLTWDWQGCENPEKIVYNDKFVNHDSFIIGDQLIIAHGNPSQENLKRLLNLNLKTLVFQTQLSYPEDTQFESNGLPIWAIILITLMVITSIIIISLYFIIRYRRKRLRKNELIESLSAKGTVDAIWSNSVNSHNSTEISTGIFKFDDVTYSNRSSSDIVWDNNHDIQIHKNTPQSQHEIDTNDNTLAATQSQYRKSITYI